MKNIYTYGEAGYGGQEEPLIMALLTLYFPFNNKLAQNVVTTGFKFLRV